MLHAVGWTLLFTRMIEGRYALDIPDVPRPS